jgi:radical SAM protein with 4Fe4S-binding SPASM domain
MIDNDINNPVEDLSKRSGNISVDPRVLEALRFMPVINFTFTNRCNLRCTYCPQGSHPDEFHADVDANFMERLITFIQEKGIVEVIVGYYGEMTLVKDWWIWANRILDLGCTMVVVSNFSRVLEPDEVKTISRFREVRLSIDTYDIATLKEVRKAVDARTIIYNTLLIRSYCLAEGYPEPEMVWTGVMTDRVAPQLRRFVAMASACGIRRVEYNDVAYYKNAKNEARNVADLSGVELTEAVSGLQRGIEYARENDVKLVILGLDRIRSKIHAELAGITPNFDVSERESPVGTYHYPNDEKDKLAVGYTRDCQSPWTEAIVDPKGDVYPCCAHGLIMGRVSDEVGFEEVLGSALYKDLRRSLYTGEGLNPTCALCPIRPAIPIAVQQERVDGLVEQSESRNLMPG